MKNFKEFVNENKLEYDHKILEIVDGILVRCLDKKVESVDIPYGVTKIGEYAFSNCTSLQNITIPSSVTSIDGSAFNNCTSLKSINIPSSVTRIGYCAFDNCTSLTNITIPDSVTKIEWSAFDYCKSLTNIKYKGENIVLFYNSKSVKLSKMKDIIDNMKNINFKDPINNYDTLIISSARYDDIDLVKLLLNHPKLDLRIKNNDGKIAFDYGDDDIWNGYIWNDYEIQKLIISKHPYMIKEFYKRFGFVDEIYNDPDEEIQERLRFNSIYKK